MELELRREAVEQAYRDHRDDVYRVAYAILQDADAAVDATHEAFARAFERWHQYDPNRPLRPWLHGIAAHEAMDLLRRRRVRNLALPVLARTAAPPDRSEDAAAVANDRQIVREALATLPPRSRAALVLRHYYGYDYAEIAAQLGTSSGTVGSLISRAHAALRELLLPAVDAGTAVDRPSRAAGERR